MTEGTITVAYIAASVLFIPRRPEQSGDREKEQCHGMTGMLIAVLATVLGAKGYRLRHCHRLYGNRQEHRFLSRQKVAMTEMPSWWRYCISFVGLAAVLVGFANYMDETIQFEGRNTIHNIEIYLGILIGAVTFTGSVIAFGKLRV